MHNMIYIAKSECSPLEGNEVVDSEALLKEEELNRLQ